MRKKLILMAAICGLFFAMQSVASEDVYVDLSVLDAMPQDSIGFVEAQPLFPEVKRIAKPAIVKKTQSVKKQKEKITKPVVDHVVNQQEDKTQEKIQQNNKVANEDKVNNEKQEVADNKVVLEIKEPEITKAQDNVSLQSEVKEQGVVENNQEDTRVLEVIKSDELSAPQKEEAEKQEESQLLLPQTVMSASVSEVISTETANVQPKEVYSLQFSENSAELSADVVRKIDDAIKTYDIEKKKKISIKAYNYDNGTDSFQKKRISLMRATEVRSYFLNQGFKNFSIKVINNTIDDEYKNTVQIEELD